MENKQVFELALGKISPWFIHKIELLTSESGEEELHIELDFPRESN